MTPQILAPDYWAHNAHAHAYAFTQIPSVVTTSNVLRAEAMTTEASAEVLTKQSAVSAKRKRMFVHFNTKE